MTNKTAASRYGRALLDVAIAEKADPELILQDLQEVRALVHANPALEKVLLNPAVPVPRKGALMREITARMSLRPQVSKLLTLLAERDRFVLLPDILETYRERLLDHQNVIRAEVTTAFPLSEDRARAIEASVARLSGRTVTLTTKVDPEIIGGVVTRVGSTVYDGSVAQQLQRMKQRLGEEGR